MRTRGLQQRLSYPARLSIKIEGQINSFPDKIGLKEYTSTKPALQDNAKETALRKGRKREREENRHEKMAMNNYLSTITLNVNGLNAPIKRHRIAEWIRKYDPCICCLQETHLRTEDLHRQKVKGWKQIFQANGQEKKARVKILISDKTDFKRRAIKRDPEDHFIILKGRIHQEDINIVTIYAPNRSTQIHKENLGGLQERY